MHLNQDGGRDHGVDEGVYIRKDWIFCMKGIAQVLRILPCGRMI
jgi:hypothetical protein